MYKCWIENEYGEKLELTNNKNYTVYQIDGLHPPDATINLSKMANVDGSRFNSSSNNERNIIIYLTLEGDCEANRINLYKYARTKRHVKFYYKNESRDICIDGYVESMQISIFEIKQRVQISIICPQPYFKAANIAPVDFALVTPKFIFPFTYEAAGEPFSVLDIGATQSVINHGDIENGVIIDMKARGVVLNPQIYNITKSEFIRLNMEMAKGDEIIINTNKTQKSVMLIHEGVKSNIINSMTVDSTWFQLLPGDNIFSTGADEYAENILCTITHVDEYEGV